jgi:site-specific DNA-methyltransferase (adenine-specific)/modification methylase
MFVVISETIGDATLYLGDCLDLLPKIGKFDALVTDPPYGIGEAGGNKGRSNLAVADQYDDLGWDDETADEAISLARSLARYQVIFGGNYYHLPPTKCWLVWNKLNGGNDFADCELAWTNLDKAVRKVDYLWHGMIRMEKHIERQHPTQKPVGVMNFCLDQLPDDAQVIADPFMGSGTTGVSCMERRKTFIGIERESTYFEIACERIYEATKQDSLF